MKRKQLFVPLCTLLLALPAFAGGKKHPDRAMIERMEAVPCGAKERGLSGLGSVFASVGATSINSTEKLCSQYMLRTDDMEYQIRPMDKHPKLLPVGREGEIKISKDVLEMKIVDGDRKNRHYQVVGMKPIDHTETTPANYKPRPSDYPDKTFTDKNTQRTSEVRNPGQTSPPQ